MSESEVEEIWTGSTQYRVDWVIILTVSQGWMKRYSLAKEPLANKSHTLQEETPLMRKSVDPNRKVCKYSCMRVVVATNTELRRNGNNR